VLQRLQPTYAFGIGISPRSPASIMQFRFHF
jgi:hypothetical protein